MIVTVWIVKITIEIIGLPLSTWLATRLKQWEDIDQYDNETAFSIWRWKVHYQSQQ